MDDPNEFGDVADVTNSPAFLSIDSLLDEGKIVEERCSYLKHKFKELHDRVLQIYNHDKFLLNRARQLRKDLDVEKNKVDKCSEEAKTNDSTIQQLKRELQAAEHELSVAQEKESMLQVEALELDRKKQNLTHEVEDAIVAEEARLRPQIEALDKDIKDLGAEIEKTALKFDELKLEREGLVRTEKGIRLDMENTANLIYDAKLEFNRIEREPDRARKQAEIVFKANQTAQKELNTLIDKIGTQNAQLREMEARRKQLEEQQCDLWATLVTQRTAIEQREKLMDNIEMSLETEKEQHQKHALHLSETEMMIKNAAITINGERDRLNKSLRDKDMSMKQFKRLEQAKADLNNEREIFSKQKDILTREMHHLKVVRKQHSDELEELKRDVDILINNFLKEEITEKRTVQDRDAIQRLIKELEEEIAERAEAEAAYNREVMNLGIKREQMSREASKWQGKVVVAKDELKVKEVIVKELKKRNGELQQRLTQLTELYSTVKRERSNKAAAIQSASQTMSETQEKIKILENELEVLRRESLIKDQDLAKRRREAHDERTHCENLRVEKNKQKQDLDAAANKERDLKQQMSKLNTVITLTEEEMLALKKKYEDAVEQRNYTGIQMIDRNDELCILYEKSNIQENILKTGIVTLHQREEEIRATAIQLADLQREMDLCQKLLPQVRDLDEDLSALTQQIEDERWRVEVLEQDLLDPANQARWRKLSKVGRGKAYSVHVSAPGSKPPRRGDITDPNVKQRDLVTGSNDDGTVVKTTVTVKPGKEKNPDGSEQVEDIVELQSKCQDLEQRVANVNEKLMEKDLVLEEVTELSNRLRNQAASGKDYTLTLANKVNAYQHSIKMKTKAMMATLSEVSMVQASSIKLEMDIKAVEDQVNVAQERVSQGLPPTETIELEYERQEADKARSLDTMKRRKERLAQQQNQAAAMRTTALQRPNAYIPDSDLMLPKPYGTNAPFMPQQSAQTNAARFCRKKQVKDLSFDDDDDDY